MEWIGRYIVDYQPDVVIHLGDHWDMSSLSSYGSALEQEGQRVKDDIDAGKEAFDQLNQPLHKYNRRRLKKYEPRKVFCTGNHEHRINRLIGDKPYLKGVLGLEDLGIEAHGWEVAPFLEPVEIDGVHYAHYFYNPNSGRPYGGTCHNKLKNIGLTFTMGHQQGKDLAERRLPNGKMQRGLVVGSCYLHKEDYRGPQGDETWHGIIVKHEVRDGAYDLMEVSLDFLCRKYEQTSLKCFLASL